MREEQARARFEAALERLRRVDPARPAVNRRRAEAALEIQLLALGIEPRPVRWADDFRTARAAAAAYDPASRIPWFMGPDLPGLGSAMVQMLLQEARSMTAAWTFFASQALVLMPALSDVARSPSFAGVAPLPMADLSAHAVAARRAPWQPPRPPHRPRPGRNRIAHLLGPGPAPPPAAARADAFVAGLEATAAGLWCYFVAEAEIVAVPRPAMRLADGRLHSAAGPAVEWPTGEAYFFWRGLHVPREWIEAPDRIDPREVFRAPNQERRRALCEILGWDRILRAANARVVHRDARGTLLEIDWPSPAPDGLDMVARFVRVRCPSTGREYALRVPPAVRTATEAVAWTFGIEGFAYAPESET